MSKKVKLPKTGLSVERDLNVYDATPEYTLWLYVDGFVAMPVHSYTKRSDAVRGARRFAAKMFDVFFHGPEYLPIYVDGDEIL